MNWRPHTEHPDRSPTSCLLASQESVTKSKTILVIISSHLWRDIYYWDGANFRNEETDAIPPVEAFWWIPESEVLQGLPE